jgi:hypothetical protein
MSTPRKRPSVALADAPKPKGRAAVRAEAMTEIGRSGTPAFSGYITADYNTDFNGLSGIDIYERMRKTDGTVAAALRAVKFPIMASEWGVQSADKEDERQNEIAEFVRANLFDRLNFPQVLRENLGYLDFGFWYSEKVYKIEGGMVVIDRLASRIPTAHQCWEMRSTHADGVTQSLPSRKAGDDVPMQPEIPLAKLVVFTNEKEGDNLAGTALLRSAYKHYFMKDQLYRIDAVKHERGAGILKIYCPSDPASLAKAAEIGENFNVNEQAYLALPGGKKEGVWDAEVMTAGIAEQSPSLMASVMHHDRLIVQSILASFLDLGAGASGSFALGDVQQSFFGYALKATADYFASVINEQLVRELVDMNYGRQEKYPKLTAPRVGQMNQKQTAEILNVLNTAGLLDKDAELLVWVAKAFGLPEIDVEALQEKRDAAAAAFRPAADPAEGPTKPATAAKDADPAADPQNGGEGAETDGDGPTEEGEEPPEPPKGGKGGDLAEKRLARRPLTYAEGRVKFAEASSAIDDAEDSARKALDAATDAQKAALLAKAGRIIDEDDVAAISDLALAGDAATEAAMQRIASESMEYGKVMAANELGVAAVATSSFARKMLKAKVALFVAERGTTITVEVQKRLMDIINGDMGKAAGLFELEKVIDAAARQANSSLVGQVVMTPLNEGRWLTFDDAKEQIHALQRSEILDMSTCELCISIDGRVLPQSDPMTQLDEVHTNCRGMWVGILKTDAELPEARPLPKSIASRFDLVGGVPTTNEVRPMKSVVITKDSRAARHKADGTLDI